MDDWRSRLRRDPIEPLMAAGDPALEHFVRRDLLGEKGLSARRLWDLPEVRRILRKQQTDGSWKYPGKQSGPAVKYSLLETFKQLRVLVGQYGLRKGHPALAAAAEFVFSCQTEEGDIRGMLANQYMPYYVGMLLQLLIEAGYGKDPRVERAMQWLLAARQEDGGWAAAVLTGKLSRAEANRLTSEHADPLPLDSTQPFSHNITGMVLRAFAAHARHRRSAAARQAARLLASRFFQSDVYSSYRDADYWVRFQYPFWWNHLVAALDSISRIGIPPDEEHVARGLRWLVRKQRADGLWDVAHGKMRRPASAGSRAMRPWIGLAICRVFARYG